jgi:hypothetical protein
MEDPRTRNEKKKNQKQKGRPDKLGSSKHIRAAEALRERKSGAAHAATANNGNNKK